jgi:hypothetical protein
LEDAEPGTHLQARRAAFQVRHRTIVRRDVDAGGLRGGVAHVDGRFFLDYRGVVLALIVIFGYMLTDLDHSGVFQVAKIHYST